jgi:hypothetical protein
MEIYRVCDIRTNFRTRVIRTNFRICVNRLNLWTCVVRTNFRACVIRTTSELLVGIITKIRICVIRTTNVSFTSFYYLCPGLCRNFSLSKTAKLFLLNLVSKIVKISFPADLYMLVFSVCTYVSERPDKFLKKNRPKCIAINVLSKLIHNLCLRNLTNRTKTWASVISKKLPLSNNRPFGTGHFETLVFILASLL